MGHGDGVDKIADDYDDLDNLVLDHNDDDDDHCEDDDDDGLLALHLLLNVVVNETADVCEDICNLTMLMIRTTMTKIMMKMMKIMKMTRSLGALRAPTSSWGALRAP